MLLAQASKRLIDQSIDQSTKWNNKPTRVREREQSSEQAKEQTKARNKSNGWLMDQSIDRSTTQNKTKTRYPITDTKTDSDWLIDQSIERSTTQNKTKQDTQLQTPRLTLTVVQECHFHTTWLFAVEKATHLKLTRNQPRNKHFSFKLQTIPGTRKSQVSLLSCHG